LAYISSTQSSISYFSNATATKDVFLTIGDGWDNSRVLDMPSDDLGASAYRKFDIEAWMPSRNGYGEVTSASNCTDYQSRRLGAKFKNTKSGDKAKFVHTLNATAVAIPRVTLAILENFQQSDGTVRIPEPLVPFMGGKTVITPRTPESS
jgi:seryl-tRNA synthetase